MQLITLETMIAAPVERCFLLSLNIDLHKDLARGTHERAISGVTQGIIGSGETVTWCGRHFGFTLTHESVISGYDRPRYFQDRMLRGAFRSFVHDHYFSEVPEGTSMRDELRFEAPFGALGRLAEIVALRRHLQVFLCQRNNGIRRIAEQKESVWGRYLTPERF